ASWVAVMLGQGIVPGEPEPTVAALDLEMIADALDKMRTSYARMAEHMPTHGEFIARTCAAAAAE
ncbi:MAG TPA: tryptophan halogenase, partial [Allosphingosinicella sp.]|nr:tryptophan halogenase [Allosphingosinicella sp.]